MLQANHTAPQEVSPAVAPVGPAAPGRAGAADRTADGRPGALAKGLLLAGIALHLLFLLSLRFGWLSPLFNDTMHRFGPGGDFFSIYAAGVKARAGESVYTIGGHVESVPYAYAFRYAPLVAYTVGAVLSCLPAIAAYAAWLIACELALLRNVRLTLALAPDRRTGYVGAALWLLFTPYFLELFVGQFTFITASLVFWAYLSWQRPSHGAGRAAGGLWKADGLWAAAALLKMMPLLFLPVALLRGRWKGALAVSLVLAGSSLIYFSHFPHDWAVFVATNGDARPAGHAGNLGLMALLYHVASERMRPFLIARGGVLSLMGASLAWLTYRAWRVLPRPEGGKQEGETQEGRRTGGSDAGRLGNAKRGQAKRAGMRRAKAEQAEAGKARSSPAAGPEAVEDRLLALYAACSAAYLLCYKDVWEHHYVLLLPPLVLLALRRQSPWLWLPPFLISALPGLFALYDLPSLGYNEDPQVYWRPATSLFHHTLKPLAPLWLLTGLLAQSLPRPAWAVTRPVHRRILQAAASCLLGLVFLGGALWARTVVARQKRVTQALVWSPQVFHKQETPQTCGPAALAAVCRHYGIPATEAEVAKLAGTTPKGTSMLGLQAAARQKGLTAQGRRLTLETLSGAPCPCILFFHPGHFAVLTGTQEATGGRDAAGGRGRRFYLADPSLGQRTMTPDQLGALWRGELLVVGPTVGRHASASAP